MLKFKSLSERILFEKRDNKSLKDVLLLMAKAFNVDHYNPSETYCVHHLNGDDTNDNIYNIALMPVRGKHSHSSFHRKVTASGYIKDSKEYWDLFYTVYEPHAVLIGTFIQDLFITVHNGNYTDGQIIE